MDTEIFINRLTEVLSQHFDWVEHQTAESYGIFFNVYSTNKGGTSVFFYFNEIWNYTPEQFDKILSDTVDQLNQLISSIPPPIK